MALDFISGPVAGRAESSSSVSQVSVIFCVRNEKFRLPYFLDYYRALGVKEFFAIDNASEDATQAYLSSQADVNLFHTAASYKSSNAGRDWTSEVAQRYCRNQWCLTLDVDEFFVFPWSEYISLEAFVDYLDTNGYEAVASLFLDYYSDKSLSQTEYSEGQSPFDICQFYDTASAYSCYPVDTFPFIEIKGGPRQRCFWPQGGERAGPSMRKVPFVKWKDGFEYLVAAHSSTPVKLADVTAVIAHFKMLAHFKEFARTEVERNQRVANSVDWKRYARKLEQEDINFFDPDISVRHTDTSGLLGQNMMVSSLRFDLHVDRLAKQFSGNKQKDILRKLRPRLAEDFASPSTGYDAVTALWGGLTQFSHFVENDTAGQQALVRLENQLDRAVTSRLWRASYGLRKLFSKMGLTDQRSLTEENYQNQSLHSRFTFVYDSIWWDILGPFRAIEKVLMRVGLLKRRS